MTMYTVLQLADKFEIDPATELVKIDPRAEKILGTSAELKGGD